MTEKFEDLRFAAEHWPECRREAGHVFEARPASRLSLLDCLSPSSPLVPLGAEAGDRQVCVHGFSRWSGDD